MSTLMSIVKDINGIPTYATSFAQDAFSTTLAAGVEQHFTVNANYPRWVAIFSFVTSDAGTQVWVADNVTATVPGASFASTLSEGNPSARIVGAGDILSFITNATTAEVSCVLFALPQGTNG
jgi:hypothetical protein